ncbi:MAG: TetR/AcrR family transcriptional regulator [Pseudomonadota bacterium]
MNQTSDLPKPRTQEERKAESERRIIRAAIELFAQQGYIRTTMNQVGDLAGYTGGLVSHRFGNKEGLLRAVIKRVGQRFAEDQLQPVTTQENAEVAITTYIDIYLREVVVRESRMRALYVMMGEALGSVPEIRDEIAQFNSGFRKQISALVERGIAQKVFHDNVNPELAATMIIGLLRGIVMQYLVDHKALNIETIIPQIQEAALGSLRVRK